MRNLYALANIGKHRGMFADDVARPNGRKANRARYALAGITFTRVDRAVLQILSSAPAIASPIASAVPDGASTLWRWCASIISISL
ncbi:Uncharacterised protein [Salmonella enterica subsp. enterica serovar Typhimurium str. DT104]|nr:Uncharacterised protein [Salmonella enterica subsp. enterica serovar Typhimurium str. DT104]